MSTSPARVIPFRSRTEIPSGTDSTKHVIQSTAESSPVIERVVDVNVSTGVIAIEDLYPEMVAVRPELNTAARLLADSIVELEEARNSVAAGDDIVADDAVQRFQSKLPELFCCRDLSSGFAALINATINALHNRHGDPLSLVQIQSLSDAMQNLRSQPFMEFDEAVNEIVAMEDAGLIVEPAEFEILADWLDE